MKGIPVRKERGALEGLCPRCGQDANWAFVDEAQTIVEVICVDCGRFQLPRAEFERSGHDMVGPGDRD